MVLTERHGEVFDLILCDIFPIFTKIDKREVCKLRWFMKGKDEFYPEIEVDDSGWGDLVGGVIIGGYNVLTHEFRWAEVPVEYFQDEVFSKKDYLIETRKAVNKVLGDLRADKRFHLIAMCTGYVLNQAAKFLLQKDWKVTRRKIEGPCQELVEKRFRKELIKIGVPSNIIRDVPSGSNRFIQLFNWVKEDPDTRERFVKTGWSSWQAKWRPRLFAK